MKLVDHLKSWSTCPSQILYPGYSPFCCAIIALAILLPSSEQVIDWYFIGSIKSIWGPIQLRKPGVFVLPKIAAGLNMDVLLKFIALICSSACPLQQLYQPNPAALFVMLEQVAFGSAPTADRTVICSTPSSLHFFAKSTGSLVSTRYNSSLSSWLALPAPKAITALVLPLRFSYSLSLFRSQIWTVMDGSIACISGSGRREIRWMFEYSLDSTRNFTTYFPTFPLPPRMTIESLLYIFQVIHKISGTKINICRICLIQPRIKLPTNSSTFPTLVCSFLIQYNLSSSMSIRSRQSPVSIPFLYAFLNSEKMNCVEDPQNNLGGIYVGSLDSANDLELLRKNNIRAVLTVASGTGLSYPKSTNIVQHLILPADDVQSFDISKHFDTGINFIERNRKHTNVLVHCHAGISRSSTIVLAYLMKVKGWSCEKALNEVRKRRQIISPNPGFIRHLFSFQRKLLLGNQNKFDSMLQVTKPPSRPTEQNTLTPSNVRMTQSVAKKNQNTEKLPENKPLNLKGNSYFDKKKSGEEEQKIVTKQSAKNLKNQEVKQQPKMNMTQTYSMAKDFGKEKTHIKSASMNKQSKVNYHYRNSDPKIMANITEQKGALFGRLLNGYRGQSYLGPLGRNLF